MELVFNLRIQSSLSAIKDNANCYMLVDKINSYPQGFCITIPAP